MTTWISSLGPGVANHLWQSTLFAAVTALVCLALRRNAARVRYGIWFVASIKFLVPFSLLIGLGGLLPKHHVVTASAPAGIYSAMDTAALPFSDVLGGVENNAIRAHRSSWERTMVVLPDAAAAVWLCGMVMVLLNWFVRWRRMYATLRQATVAESGREVEILRRVGRAAGMREQVTLLLSEGLMEPGILGVRTLRLIWPARLSERLEDEHIETIMAHELVHVRRRDNLTVMLHMVVEAVFWFHPLVWWMERRMVEEREHACDEAVVAAGGNPEIYAEGLLKAVRFCVESPMVCVPGISGADLSRRVRAIMTMRMMQMSMAKKMVLGALALMILAGPVIFGQMSSAQREEVSIPTAKKLNFEVASIKENDSHINHGGANLDLLSGDVFKPTGGRYNAQNYPLNIYIGFAYKLTRSQAEDLAKQLPKWALMPGGDAWDIEARADGNPTKDEYREMMRSLLAQRFGLKVHTVTKAVPVYALVMAKPGELGPQLKRHDDATPCTDDVKFTAAPNPATVPTIDGGFPLHCGGMERVKFLRGHVDLGGRAVTMDQFANGVHGWLYGINELGRPLINQTGLKGTYDLTFSFEITTVPGSAPVEDPAPPFPNALIQELGLKMQSTKAPVEFLVVDHVEKPTEN